MSLTYNQIIKINREFADAHHIIKNFGAGDVWDIVRHNQELDYKYPLMWMEDVSQSNTAKEFTYSYRVWFIETVPELVDRNDDLMYVNDIDAKSDMLECAKDLMSYWENNTDYPTLRLQKNFNYTLFTDKLEDRVAGAYIDFKLTIPFNYNRCLIPMSGITPPSDSCEPVTIFEDGILVDTVPSGGSYSYSSGGDPAGNTMNGTTLTDIAGGTTKAFTIRYEDDSPVTVTTITDNATSFIGEVPNPATGGNCAVWKSGQTRVNQAGDDGSTQRGRGVDWWNLDSNNPFGNAKRFTGTTGGYQDETDSLYYDKDGVATTSSLAFPNDVALDWVCGDEVGESVIAYRRTAEAATNANLMYSGAPYTHDGYSDWYPTNGREFFNICNMELVGDPNRYTWLEYDPFNISVASVPLWIGSMGRISNHTTVYSASLIASNANTTTGRGWIMTRTYTYTELGL